jgi:hypothetical protein
MQKKDVVRVSASATVRSMPRQRTPSILAVSTRRQTQVESQIYTAALDAVLAEWVRQHLGADGKRP